MRSAGVSRRTFVKHAAGLTVAVPAATRAIGAQPATPSRRLLMYVGTFSASSEEVTAGSHGRGIHIFEVDRSSGALKPVGVYAHGTSPSALVFNAAGTRLYTTNASDAVDNGTSGTVSALAVDRASGELSLLNTVSSGGLGPTDVNIHPAGRHVLVANYSGGTVAVLPLLPDGRLGSATDVQKTAGTLGPTRASSAPPGSFAISGHDAPHPHMVQADATGRYVLAPDLGLDRIFIWQFEEQSGKLRSADPDSVAFPPGDGPRHFAFHPNQRWLYALQEEGSTLVLLDFDASQGRLTARQTVSSLPPGYAGSNFTSGIQVSADGRFVYAANRLHESIAWFAVGADGTLTFVDETWTRGSYPRSFAIDPSGTLLYVCNQRADHLTTFRVDQKTGGLTFTGLYTPVGSPSAIAFLG